MTSCTNSLTFCAKPLKTKNSSSKLATIPNVRHSLLFHRPALGAERTSEGYRLEWTGTKVMGVLNVTPDSFSDGGRFETLEAAVSHAQALLAAGAFILDIGGESTRPGAEPVTRDEEIDRVLPLIRRLAGSTDTLLSIDTTKPEVAAAALEAGARLVNDVSGLKNPELRAVCRDFGAPAILMHMRGEPRTMQENSHYEDMVSEVAQFLKNQADLALEEGVPSVVIDPGFGFGKTLAHNLELVRCFKRFTELGHPAMLGASRKASIGKLTGVRNAALRVPGSLALHLYAALQGAALVRAHDVAEHVQALKVWEALYG